MIMLNNQYTKESFNSEESEYFSLNCVVKQGCMMVPTLFNIYFSFLLYYAFANNVGVYLHFRLDRGIFNIRGFQAKTKVRDFNVPDLFFADDRVTVAHDSVSFKND